MVIQLSPAWNPSSTSFSNSARESRSATPHSVSWYAVYSGSVPHQGQRTGASSVIIR